MRAVHGSIIVVTAAAALLASCSSSTTGTNSSGLPQCQGAPQSTGPGSPACNSCLQANCASDVSSVESACSAYLSCYQGCQCTNNACITGCLSDTQTGTCSSAFSSIQLCESTRCSGPCNLSGSDAG